jgi:hypothetical protein
MRLVLVSTLAFVLVSAAATASSGPDAAPLAKDDPRIAELLLKANQEISGQRIYDCIDKITNDAPYSYRLMNTPTHDQFVQKYGKVFSTMDPRFKDQVVHFKEGGSNPGQVGGEALPDGGDNIIGILPGKDLTKWVVLGGHYDTREETLGGAAIDNTSGICTVQEIARAYLALGIEPEVTLVFAWWDGEEWGLFGARAFVADHSATKELLGLDKDAAVDILMGHSYDIVGINYPAYNTWVNYGEPGNVMEYAVLNLRTAPIGEGNFTLCPSYGCYTKLVERDDFESKILPGFVRYNGLVKEIATGLLKLPDQYVQVRDDKYGRSDHVPFIAAGIPGMRIQGSHDNEWPHYHHPSDTLPAAVTMAGGIDKLQSGFDTAAAAGGLTAIYAALTGGLGEYGANATSPYQNVCHEGRAPDGTCRDGIKVDQTPFLPAAAVMAMMYVAALAIRRRTG